MSGAQIFAVVGIWLLLLVCDWLLCRVIDAHDEMRLSATQPAEIEASAKHYFWMLVTLLVECFAAIAGILAWLTSSAVMVVICVMFCAVAVVAVGISDHAKRKYHQLTLLRG